MSRSLLGRGGFRRSLYGTLAAVAVLAGSIVVAPTGHAAGARGAAYAWVNDPSPPLNQTNTLVGRYQYNSSGGALEIVRKSTGVYRITPHGLGGFGVPQVTTYGGGSAYCSASDYTPPEQAYVDVLCFLPDGTRSDQRFTMSFTNVTSSPGHPLAYTYVETNGTILASRDFNSTGAANTVSRSLGRYLVRLPGMAIFGHGGHVQVTAGDVKRLCGLEYWYSDGADIVARVVCWISDGSGLGTVYSQNANFYLTYTEGQSILGGPVGSGAAYAWAGNPSSASYQPDFAYAWSSSGREITITRSGVGAYSVHPAGVSMFGGNVQVSSYSFEGTHCGVASWASAGAEVRCFTAAGTPADAAYTFAFSR